MDERYVMTTPENIPISYELAGVGSRFVAALLDMFIVLVVQTGLLFVAAITLPLGAMLRNLGVGGPFLSTFSASVLAIVLLLSFALLLGYPLLFEIVWNGRHPGSAGRWQSNHRLGRRDSQRVAACRLFAGIISSALW